MLDKWKPLLLEGLKRSYNARFIRFIFRNYILIFPKWINTKNLPFYISVLFVSLYWLYYEIFSVSPVCAFYTGPDFPSLLNKFKSVGKTYRPTVYLINSKLQWLFLRFYCRLELFYKVSKFRISQGASPIVLYLYKIGIFLDSLLLRSFLYRRIFKNQPMISLREVVEGHNGSLVVLDWYLPKWVAPECKTCGLFKQDETFYTTENTPNVFSRINPLDFNRNFNLNHSLRPDKTDYFKMFTIDSVNPQEATKEDSDSDIRDDSSSSQLSSSSASFGANYKGLPSRISENTVKVDLGDIDIADLVNDHLEKFRETLPMSKVTEKLELLNERPTDTPNPKIIRGVLVIIGDMNVSYRICSTKAGCYCNSKKFERNPEACQSCNENNRRDYEGYNLEHPGFPTLRSLINDSLRSGFVCVHLHLNVNLGMASEAFPEATTLRSFPISLYSDVLIDLDKALNKIVERFPNCSLVTVGINLGSNILMEYLSVSSKGGTFKVNSDSDLDNYTEITPSADDLNTQLGQENKETSIGKHHPENQVSQISSSSELKGYNMSEYSHSSRTSESMEKKSSSHRSKNLLKNDQKTPLNGSRVETQRPPDTASRSSIPSKVSSEPLYDDHFAMDLNREEFATETKIAFPQISTHITLNPEKISAAVCINLNLKLQSQVLYNISKRKYKMSGIYKRFCLSTFKEQLLGLLNSVHCGRTNKTLKKDCINFNCCHQKMIRKFGLKKFFYRIFTLRSKIKPINSYSTEKLITQLHREYRHSYRDIKNEDREFINYGASLFDKLGVRTGSDFKVSILMTLKHRFEREGTEGKVKIRHITEPPVYRCINKKVNTNLRIGKSVFVKRATKLGSNVHRILDYKVTKYINSLINSDCSRNITNIKENMELVKVPTLLLYSLDNSMFTLRDIDIFEVIKNPNIVYYISRSGGFSTFLAGIRPSTWFIGPVLEFLEEMSTKSKTF